jgi:hypothetical protein
MTVTECTALLDADIVLLVSLRQLNLSSPPDGAVERASKTQPPLRRRAIYAHNPNDRKHSHFKKATRCRF